MDGGIRTPRSSTQGRGPGPLDDTHAEEISSIKLTNIQDLHNLFLFWMRYELFVTEMFELLGKCPAVKLYDNKKFVDRQN